jgi:hypothetical protein
LELRLRYLPTSTIRSLLVAETFPQSNYQSACHRRALLK